LAPALASFPSFSKFPLYPVVLFAFVAIHCHTCWARSVPPHRATGLQEARRREPESSAATQPVDLSSKNGVLRVTLKVRNSLDSYGHMRYCYVDGNGNQSPTLRLQPGDRLILAL
jgi:hypothetical protein